MEIVVDDPDVERVRRGHLNDMENIYLFFVVGMAYVFTNPDATLAMWLFRVYAAARILHTLVYAVYPVPQPTRAIMFLSGVIITAFMAIRTIVYFA